MNHASPIFGGIAALAALAPTASAVQVDASRIYPAPLTIRDAGVIDATTGARSARSNSTKLGTTVVYNNTCNWTGGAFYAGLEPCEDAYDDGRVPSTGSTGIQDSHVMQSFTIGYCNFNGPLGASGTGADIEVAFFDNLGGTCVGGTPPTGPTGAPLSSVATAYFDLAGLGLPGSSAAGFAGCWSVTLDTSNAGWVMQADGDGVFDGTPALDNFSWAFAQNEVSQGPTPNGVIVAGEPATGGYGACSYSIACGTDALTGSSCGTGLDVFDAYWVNVDGVAVGQSSAGCAGAAALGTGCYMFGGYPTNPLSSLWMKLEGEGRVICLTSCGYCTSKPSSIPGCVPHISAQVVSPTNILITAGPVPGGPQPGIVIYTTNGLLATPVQNAFGFLCIQPGAGFFRVLPPVFAGGTTGVCNGSYIVDFAAWVATGMDAALVTGAFVNLQMWYRDPPNIGSANFTNASGFSFP